MLLCASNGASLTCSGGPACSRKYPRSTIVTDSVTSNGLAEFIRQLGGKHFRYRRGYKNVISKGVELNKKGVQTELMMETSGHGAMRENHFLDDGTYSASQIIIELVKRRLEGKGDVTTDLLEQLKEPAESREFRLRIRVGLHGEGGGGRQVCMCAVVSFKNS